MVLLEVIFFISSHNVLSSLAFLPSFFLFLKFYSGLFLDILGKYLFVF